MTKVARCSWSLLSGDRASLNDPHLKILEKNPNKEMLLIVWHEVPMDMDVRGFLRCACGVDTWFSWIAYKRPMGIK